jgi:hypothetical protein
MVEVKSLSLTLGLEKGLGHGHKLEKLWWREVFVWFRKAV